MIKERKFAYISLLKLSVIVFLLLLSIILPKTTFAVFYNPFSWSDNQATLLNPFSWSNQSATWKNPFSVLPGCTNNCIDSPVAGRSGPAGGQAGASASSQGTVYRGGEGLGGLLTWFLRMLRLLFPILIAVAVVWFAYNVFQYTIYLTGDDERAKAKTDIMWGIVGIFVMVSIWGLVNILQSTFTLSNQMIQAPEIQTSVPPRQ